MELTHLDAQGQANMVDVGAKAETRRTAEAAATLTMQKETLQDLPMQKSKSTEHLM